MAGADLVCALTPADDVEAEHQQDVLRWLQSTDDIYRRVKPDAGESCALRWWTPADLRAADPARFDPLLMGSAPRFGKAGPTSSRAGTAVPADQPVRPA
jgi:hypothetical protein